MIMMSNEKRHVGAHIAQGVRFPLSSPDFHLVFFLPTYRNTQSTRRPGDPDTKNLTISQTLY